MIIGIDLGGTKIAAALATPSGRILTDVNIPTEASKGQKQVIDNIIKSVHTLIKGQRTRISCLGIGIPPSVPSWGMMVAENRNYIETAWWVITLPGLAIFIATLAINFVGDGLRDLLDPRRRY